jgi:hypothetical protein
MTLALLPHVQDEVGYAADLFSRADKALSDELAALDAAGIQIDHTVRLSFAICLSRISFELRLLHLQSLEARA